MLCGTPFIIQYTENMASFRRKLKRFEGLGDARYLTCSCYRRLPLFNNDDIKDAFVEHLAHVQHVLSFELFAWVIMPEHFHLLLRPRMTGGQTVTQILRRLKSPFARRVIARWRELDAAVLARITTDATGAVRFWQTGGGYDRNIHSDEEFIEKIEYIHANPVRRGLVVRPADYRWSSALNIAGATDGSRPVLTRLV